MDNPQKAQFFAAADAMLAAGRNPEPEFLLDQCRLNDIAEAEELLSEWRKGLGNRLGTPRSPIAGEVPESVQAMMARLWQAAVDEATDRANLIQQIRVQPEEAQAKACDDALRESRGEISELEKRYGELERRFEALQDRATAREKEIESLKQDLSQERNEHQRTAQMHANVCQELAQLQKTHQDAQKVFEQRLKDEKRYSLEAIAKAEVDTRHYRNALDKLRDESGRAEADLSRQLSGVESQLGKRDAKIDTLTTQLKLTSDELGRLKSEDVQQNKEQAQLSSQLLAERNKVKRLEKQVLEGEQARDKVAARLEALTAESSKREQQLRSQLQNSEDQLQKSQSSLATMEKRIAALEEENRRLKNRT